MYTINVDIEIDGNNEEQAIANISQILADARLKFWIGDINEVE